MQNTPKLPSPGGIEANPSYWNDPIISRLTLAQTVSDELAFRNFQLANTLMSLLERFANAGNFTAMRSAYSELAKEGLRCDFSTLHSQVEFDPTKHSHLWPDEKLGVGERVTIAVPEGRMLGTTFFARAKVIRAAPAPEAP